MGTPLRVLIVEDSEEDTLLIVRELKRGGYDPVHERVETAEAMKAALSTKTWDLILADYTMPHFSGLEALKLLKTSGLDLPFIIISGSIGEDVAVEAMKAGAHDYLMKSNLTRLVPAIEQELREAEVRRKLKEYQNALQESEKRYRQLVESATEIIYTVDEKGNFTYGNSAGLKVTGYSLQELRGLNYTDLVVPDHRERVSQAYINQFREGRPTSYIEFPFFSKSGEIIWFGQNTTLVMEEDKIVGFQIIARDITERKRVEQALQQSEERFRQLFDNAPVGYFEYDNQGRITNVNHTELEILGYTAEEMIGQPVWKFVVEDEDARQKAMAKLAGVLPPAQNLERTYRRKDGTTLPVLIEDRLIRDSNGRIAAIRTTIQDITERKKVEEALRSEKTWSEAIVSSAPNIVVGLGKGSEILIFNKFAEKLTGFRAEEVVGRPWLEIFIPEEMRGQLYGVWDEIVKNKLIEHQYENTIVTKQGDKRIISWNNTVLTQDGEFRMVLSIGDDITERKRAEQALFDSEQRYRNLVDNAPDVIFTLAPDGTITSLNPAFETITGWSRSEWLGKAFTAILRPDDLSRGLELFQRIMKGEKIAPFELRVLKKSGDYLVAEFTVTPQTQNGSVIGMLGIARDITERKAAEERMRVQSAALGAAANAIIITDHEGMIEWTNPAFTVLTGYSHAEVVGRNPRELIKSGEQNQAFYKDLWDTILTGKVWRGQIVNRRKDGSLYTEEMTITPLHNERGEVSRFIAIKQDITERKRAEEALQKSEEEARKLAQENATMAEIGRVISSTLNIDEVYERFAEEVKKIISFDRIVINIIDTEKSTAKNVYVAGKELQGRNVGDIYPLEGSGHTEVVQAKSTLLIQTEDFSEYKDRFPMLLLTFQAGFRSILNVPLFSKGEIIGGLLLRCLKPHAYTDKDVRLAERIGSQIAGAIANAQLFTEHLRAEEEKATLQEQLRQSQKIEAIGRLAGGIAHDFNNLLTVIKGYSQLSLTELKEDVPLRGNIEEIKRASDKAADLTRQLLAFSRRQILEVKVLDLNTVLRDMDKMLRRLIGEDIELITLLADDLGRVKTDPGWIEQIIMNLTVNARDAMPSVGKLTIETANVELDGAYARNHIAVTPGPYVMLSVSDTGVGMAPEVRQQVFEPFFTTKEKSKGTGLGLSTVYGIVKQSGGNIWVYSEPGQGTTFKIYLHRVDEPLDEIKGKVVEEELPRGNETILIVEDEEDVLTLTGRILSRQGYNVLEVTNGGEAMEVCKRQKQPIHLILTDVVMPQMSGRELIERCREIRQDFKTIYMSGYTDDTITHHGILEKGMNYIQKPFTVKGVTRKVRQVLDK